ncbi:phytanoyl-CoA dioxygenase domain-containing protein 1 homolog [Aphis gossypii]|uniref:phytanoyl-CoA dioxygenase domain-containing protein 1 homolog n=1 Tax=Aphis gossypii TaxID=80765 RepID=UPI002158C423|nr:phytanoyl-CoA dioxygenase domain-containing protein 1 homolog [Aphis gossypii]XP_027849005.2 phytanoyl-CoA dioxygenase domain-containing protein 1 homolog [Aphis gossypii]XP_027849006.2 phytanoyl-CoA dioxygenase domain-containing protein 1 homolog [Aphis gossypii]XP_027849007.2 phytanoyl-CoA dioxygenase domain-containing protein 1 homolog [Aphis gossypii]XP_027849008.2 phytanoyl-CoA dioxygenase domain-containing protein 1 homolog [Aphis gossypii]XP_050054808.1 phytanoyl-CoA dioxygenase doma
MIYEDLKSKFDKNGYVVIKNFLSEKETKDLKDAGEKLTENVPADVKTVFVASNTKHVGDDYFIESADKISFFYEKAALDDDGRLLVDASLALNKVGHALHRLHPTFEACTYSDKVTNVCRSLGLSKPVVPQSMYIYKNPGVGGQVVSHQDSTFLFTEPDSLVGFWIALDDATVENGCLWMIPGSHKTDVQKRFIRNPDKCATTQLVFQGTQPEYEQSLYVPLPVEKSSLVLIHGKVVHKSEQNKSQYPRHAYTFHIFDEGISQYSEQNWLQTKVGFKPIYTT